MFQSAMISNSKNVFIKLCKYSYKKYEHRVSWVDLEGPLVVSKPSGSVFSGNGIVASPEAILEYIDLYMVSRNLEKVFVWYHFRTY